MDAKIRGGQRDRDMVTSGVNVNMENVRLCGASVACNTYYCIIRRSWRAGTSAFQGMWQEEQRKICLTRE